MGEPADVERRSALRTVTIASGMGLSVIALLVLTVGGGIWLDGRLDSAPLWTLVGIALGLATIVGEFVLLVRSSGRAAASLSGRRATTPPTARVGPGWDDDE